ncbi:DNA utilization protein GntX [compost metagenome]
MRHYLINRSAVAYNGTMREWLAQYKFRGNEAYSALLARMMGVATKSMLSELEERTQDNHFHFDAIVPVPISEERMMERGFNQTRTLAYGAATLSRTKVFEILHRPLHTEKQSFMSRRDRLQNLSGVYQPVTDASEQLTSISQRNAPIRILLIDDVYTTGSTINTCARVIHQVCKPLGIESEVYSLTWARS